jgi:hypothetical protein
MICPMPNNHDPNPAAVPIKEAIKETFRVFMAHPRLLDTIKTLVLFRSDSAKLGYTLQRFLEPYFIAGSPNATHCAMNAKYGLIGFPRLTSSLPGARTVSRPQSQRQSICAC